MEDCWDDFWQKRNRPLTPKEESIFLKNYIVMESLIMEHFWMRKWEWMPMSLEIGCGRATISNAIAKRLGFETWTMDIIARPENKHLFFYGDVLDSDWPIEETYDFIFSYGLLEHFRYPEQKHIINNCDRYLSERGLQMHYVVPQKIVNFFEDQTVYRDYCKEIMREYDKSLFWLYPLVGRKWITNSVMGKGFIIKQKKKNEYIGPNNGKVVFH